MIQPVNKNSFKIYQEKYFPQLNNVLVRPFIDYSGGVSAGRGWVSEKKKRQKIVSKTKVKSHFTLGGHYWRLVKWSV